MTEADEDISRILKAVNTMPQALRMGQTSWRVTRAKRLHPFARAQFYRARKSFFKARNVTLELVSEQDWHAACFGEDGAYSLDLLIVDRTPVWIVSIYRAVRKLKTLVGQSRRVK